MNHKEFLTNPVMCPLPWTGFYMNVDGEVKNCIVSETNIGSLRDEPLDNILHGQKNLDIQQSMLSGVEHKNCQECHKLEQGKSNFDIVSSRVYYIRELKSVPMSTYQPDNFDLYHCDIRWQNTCNFGCVYCNPRFSSKLASELKQEVIRPSKEYRDQVKKYIFDHASQLKNIYLAGGEPLLMTENEEFLKLLLEVNPNVSIRVNTNLSKTGTEVFDLLLQFKNVHWTVSVETVEQEYDYIRFGGNWLDFTSNLNIIKQTGHKISFNMLWFVLNYNSIFGCVEWLQAQGFHNNSYIIGPLTGPGYFDCRHLPDRMLNSLELQLEERLSKNPGFLLEDSYRNMLTHIRKPFTKDLPRTLEQLGALDSRRNLNSWEIFKEFYKEINHGN